MGPPSTTEPRTANSGNSAAERLRVARADDRHDFRGVGTAWPRVANTLGFPLSQFGYVAQCAAQLFGTPSPEAQPDEVVDFGDDLGSDWIEVATARREEDARRASIRGIRASLDQTLPLDQAHHRGHRLLRQACPSGE